MMKQARDMQKNMKVMQDKLEKTEITGSAANDMVKVTISGKNEVRRVQINPEAVDTDDIETLEDMIAAAFNNAQTQLNSLAQEEMNKVTGGMSIPGLM